MPRLAFIAIACTLATQASAQELLLPQNRHAFFAADQIELAVAGLDKNATATVELIPTLPG